ncbi:Ctr copper transporter [Limtongia smithiae]|uniref:Ctr copper transporter n=1 Tax=Limtongia smithiae TaxID=1125753 RepID=UPI0034CF0C6C
MLWNWYTIDSCFIARSWHVKTRGMFAGSCIGVVCMVVMLEFLRRAGKEYDRYIVRQHIAKYQQQSADSASSSSEKCCTPAPGSKKVAPFKPSILQQLVRAGFHLLQFALAYFIMLLAMYYNGYIIICIFIGSYLGAFIFTWETISLEASSTSVAEEATVCCG